jgi:hypothetical protein
VAVRPLAIRTCLRSRSCSARWCRRPPTWRSSHRPSGRAGSRVAGTPTRSPCGTRTGSRSRSLAAHAPAPPCPAHGVPHATRSTSVRSTPTGHRTGHWGTHVENSHVDQQPGSQDRYRQITTNQDQIPS